MMLRMTRMRCDDSVWANNRRDGPASARVLVVLEIVLKELIVFFVVARSAPEDTACSIEEPGHLFNRPSRTAELEVGCNEI